MSSHTFIEMIVSKKYFDVINTLYFVLDNVMFWEAYRWERLDLGHIYIQKFPEGKMYAGLTTDLERILKEYEQLKGNNPHHTRALKKYGVNTMQISFTQCPNYLLDAVEIFVIAFFELTNPSKGYNKTTGGRKGYRMSKETRMNMSNSRYGEKNHWFGKSLPKEMRYKLSIAKSGRNHPNFGKKLSQETRAKISDKHIGKTFSEETRVKLSIALSGVNNPFFGRTHTDDSRSKISVANSGKNHPMFGRHHTEKTCVKMSESKKGEKNYKAKPICVFGKLYDSASTASDILCDVCDTTAKGNFMIQWIRRKKHPHNVFYVSKEFYKEMKGANECITRDMYEQWSAQL
ncbi:GIY-YIG catalytic domain-containing endonuclease [Acanthocystis turfacea Chlorella virus NE-JV-2]|nr:GIY-YIG catalytic domain-containing endonuclease [Acanthocystis turfacea Chlorella virus NE-JV-2]